MKKLHNYRLAFLAVFIGALGMLTPRPVLVRYEWEITVFILAPCSMLAAWDIVTSGKSGS